MKLNHIIKANISMIKELSMTYDEYVEDGNKSVEYFKHEISKLFPNAFSVKAILNKNLGTSITFSYIGDEWKVTRHNASELLEFMMHFGESTKPVDVTKFEIEMLMQSTFFRKNIKFRKISAKTPIEATKKLVDWFKKNKSVIDAAANQKK